jgi:DNA-binding NtrC family response regulator/tetratricopeptide (TPR) repeat protein
MAEPHRIAEGHPTARIVGHSPSIHRLREQIRYLASFDTVGNPHVPTILLHGETGTGKGLVARVIHDSGPRARGPFITVNCAAIPETLLEAELFGFEAGSFTDAKRPKPGLLEVASGGTLFLDEVAALPIALQSKLLIVLEEKRVRRLGALVERPLDVKLVAATQEILSQRVSDGRFRADLYHRLAVVLLDLPPLRERQEDVLLLAQHFLRRYAEAYGLVPKRLSGAAEAWLVSYRWPGNVREVGHLMERVTLLNPEAILAPDALERLCLPRSLQPVSAKPGPSNGVSAPLDEPARIRHALLQTGGNVVRAARLLGLSRSALRHRMRRYRIERALPQQLSPLVRAEPDAGRTLPQSTTPPLSTLQRPAVGRMPPTPAAAPAPDWQQRPVAVLAMSLTFPTTAAPRGQRYEPWTAMAQWQQAIAAKVEAFGGVLLPHGSALLTAVFGIPQALEQLPQRPVQAALAIQRAVAEARRPEKQEPGPDVRLAVHVGAMLVDLQADDPTARLLAVGETLALPMWLLGQAASGEILLSPRVAQQVEGMLTLEARPLLRRGEPSADGKAYAVVGRGPGRVLTQFVGRQRELTALRDLLARAEGGHGQVVGIVGEPGVGKSRLLYEFQRQSVGAGSASAPAEQPVKYLEGRCLSYGSATPYLVLLDLLRHHCGITETDSPEVVVAKVQEVLLALSMEPEPWQMYLLQLLGLPARTERLPALSPEALKARTFGALRQVLLNSSRQQPLIIAVEDLQWIDKTSEDFLASLVESLPAASILVLALYRPGYRPPWIEKSYATQMALPPLSPQESLSLVQAIFQTEPVQHSLVQTILAKAEGNPFFLEELARHVRERGDGRTEVTVPDTIHGVIMARIDRLPDDARRVLQAAGVLGREVFPGLLHALGEGPGHPLAGLEELMRLEFLSEQTAGGELVYRFRHVLTQEVAYESLSQAQRQTLHARAGRALEALYGDRLEAVYDRLAYHYAHAVEVEKTIDYLTRLAEKAARGFAYTEAINALEEALVHAEHLAADSRDHCCVELVLRLVFSLSMLGRFQGVLDLLLCQRERVERVQDPRLAGPYYFRLGLTYSYLGAQQQAAQHAERALAEAQRCGDEATMGKAHYVLALQAWWSGQPRPGVEHGRQAVALLERIQKRHWLEQHWLGLAYWVLGMNHYCLGEFAVALQAEARVAAIGEAMEDQRLAGFAAWATGWVYATMGESEAAIEACQRGLERSRDPLNTAASLGNQGYAYLEKGDPARAIPLLRQAAQRFGELHIRQTQARFLIYLSEAHLLRHELVQARDLAAQGLAWTRDTEYGYGMAWAQRALGRIAQASGACSEAEAHLQEALRTFTAMQARFEVGRTHLVLAELRHMQGDRAALAQHLIDAHRLFKTLQMRKYVERAAQLARRLEVTLNFA